MRRDDRVLHWEHGESAIDSISCSPTRLVEKLNPMATSSGPGSSSRFLLIGQGDELADALRDGLGENHDVVQAADCDEALRVIAEGGADVVLLCTAVGDPEAVRAIGQLLTALLTSEPDR